MTKIMLKVRVSTLLAIIMATLIVLPVLAFTIWISVDPGDQTVTSNLPVWTVYMGKAPGCPETDLKFKVYYGDGYSATRTNINACSPWGEGHYFSVGNFTQNWYVGQGSSTFSYRISTYVHRH